MKLNKKQQIGTGKKDSFTLMEILVYIGVLSLIVVTFSSFLLWLSSSTTRARAMREVLDNARRAVEIMTYEIKKAKNISSTSTATHLFLENATATEFYLCGTASTTLCLKKESESPVNLTSDKVEIKNLTFTQIATATTTPSVQINLKVDYKNPGDIPEYQASVSITSTVSLRNY